MGMAEFGCTREKIDKVAILWKGQPLINYSDSHDLGSYFSRQVFYLAPLEAKFLTYLHVLSFGFKLIQKLP